MKSIFILLFLSFGWPGYSQTTASAAEQKDSPVKIGTYKFIPASAGKPGHIEIKFTNISGKKVKQVWFHWQELNAQGDSLTLGEGDITSGYKPPKGRIGYFFCLRCSHAGK